MYGKIIICCQLKAVTGLHIGGSASFSFIGGVDSPVVRDPMTGNPIVPGSSLKGKLRTLLARSLSKDIAALPDCNKDDERIRRMFGSAQPVCRSRLQFSDCPILEESLRQFREIGVTEVKTENGIDRKTSQAKPRQIERVSAGVRFQVRIVYDVMAPEETREDLEQLVHAMQLLQLDYLGGHGSRGSGRVSFSDFTFSCYQTDWDEEMLSTIFKKAENYGLLPV